MAKKKHSPPNLLAPDKKKMLAAKNIILESTASLRPLFAVLREIAEFHLVGGCIRSALLGQATKDVDIAIDRPIAEVASELRNRNIRVVDSGLKHNTILLPVEAPLTHVELSSYRNRGGIEQDLLFRDFTINAIAFCLESEALIDPYEGKQDIESGLLRLVNDDQERFKEDPLRTLRLVRFAAQLGFEVEPLTKNAARDCAALLDSVSVERVREELFLILLAPHVSRGLRLLVELGLIPYTLPEIEASIGLVQNEFHYADVFEHTLDVVSSTPPDLVLRLSALLHDVGKPATLSVDQSGSRHFYKHEVMGEDLCRTLLERLKAPKQLTKDVCLLVRTHMRPTDAGPSGFRRLLRDLGQLFPAWRLLKEADARSSSMEASVLVSQLHDFDSRVTKHLNEPLSRRAFSLEINGDDVVAHGVPFGPMVGEILRKLKDEVLEDPELNTKERLLSRVKELYP